MRHSSGIASVIIGVKFKCLRQEGHTSFQVFFECLQLSIWATWTSLMMTSQERMFKILDAIWIASMMSRSFDEIGI